METITLNERKELKNLKEKNFENLKRTEQKRYFALIQKYGFYKYSKINKFMEYFKKNYTFDLTEKGEKRYIFELENVEVNQYFFKFYNLKTFKGDNSCLFYRIQYMKKAGYIEIIKRED